MKKSQKFIDAMGEKYLTSGQLKFDEPLKNHTTFKIGGPAKIFFKAKSIDQLIKAVRICQKLGLPYFILGGGSNILVADSGFEGVVVKNEAKGLRVLGYKGQVKTPSQRLVGFWPKKSKVKSVFIEAESGVLVNRLVRFTLNKGIGGLENFLGLPGTVGGAIYTNAHNLKWGDFFGDHLLEACLLTPDGEIKKVSREYFHFAYDKSKIQETKEIVLTATFSFKPKEKEKLWGKANKVVEYRKKTQPLGVASAGCIFKNIKKDQALRTPTPGFVTSAGFLIEKAGLKGKKIGGAQISSIHANFILNVGQATAFDVLKLIRVVKKKVKEKFGVELEEEIEIIGDF